MSTMSTRYPSGSPCPLRANRRYVRMVWPRPGSPCVLTMLSPGPVGYWVHWVDGRTSPCLGSGRCAQCEDRSPLYQGFASAWNRALNQPCMAVLTEGAVRQLLRVVCEYGGMRGALVELRRDGESTKSPVAVSMKGWSPNANNLPTADDVNAFLTQLWRVPMSTLERCAAVDHAIPDEDIAAAMMPTPEEASQVADRKEAAAYWSAKRRATQ